jgi:hypothetical protein
VIRRRRWPAVFVLAALAAVPLLAAVEVKLKLPVRAKLDLAGRRTIAALPFLVVGREGGEGRAAGNVEVGKEFDRYLIKLIRRETELKVVEPGPIDLPSFDLEVLSRNKDFWRAIGERVQADLLLVGSVDFDVQDKSGYRTEEYVSPFDGRTYYRQVLVEQTGYEYDIVMMVFDGKTGDRLYNDNFKDFKQFEGEKADPLRGMFENLTSLEDRIVGIFSQKTVEATRVLFTE